VILSGSNHRHSKLSDQIDKERKKRENGNCGELAMHPNEKKKRPEVHTQNLHLVIKKVFTNNKLICR
jgi:hypothetical protein